MGKCKIERFTLTTIKNLLSKLDLEAVRANLSQLVGAAVLEVSGKVRKCAKRENVCRLVIEPRDVPGLTVIADLLSDAEKVRNSKIRKNSSVTIRGKFASVGSSAVCLSDCRLI
jgi:hypothetical protein